MGVLQPLLKITEITVLVTLLIIPSHGLNVGLIAGDNKRLSSPLIIRKVSKLSPVFININSGLPKIKSLPPLPKLPPKPPPLSMAKLPKPKRSLLSPIPPFLLPPLLPTFPILPILPPLIPPLLPIIPRLPIIPPFPILPLLPKLSDPLKPLRVPILSKSPLLKALGPKIKPVNIKRDILAKLLDLKLKGSLTTPEYIRFKKLLVKDCAITMKRL